MNHHAYRTGSRVNQSPSEHVMARPLDGVRAKIARAKVHAQEADLICKEIANQASREIFSEPDGDDTKLVFKIGSIPQIPLSLSTIIGDSLNNIRAAFDHLACQLVLLDGGTPSHYTNFPIYHRDPQPRMVPPITSTDIQAAIVAAYRESAREWTDQLWVINKLANIDKHRLLLTTAITTNWMGASWGLPEGVRSPIVRTNASPLQNDSPLAWFDFQGTVPPRDFNPHLSVNVVIFERHFHWSTEQQAGELLEGLIHILTTRISQHFVRLFPDEGQLFLFS